MGLLIVGLWLGFAFAVQNTVVRPLQTVSNLLAAFREEDYSFRARGSKGDDALAQVMFEVNALAETLRQQRLGALEATALLRKVIDEIDVAIFTFDPGAGPAPREPRRASGSWPGPRSSSWAGAPTSSASRRRSTDPSARVLDLALPGAVGRFEVHGGTFRQGGLPHRLLVLADVSRALREEERQAWQRLIRVLGHELNNSLAPIKSIAGSLESLLATRPAARRLGRGHAPRAGRGRRPARNRCRASWRPTRGWRACPRRSSSRSTWAPWCGAWRGSRPG